MEVENGKQSGENEAVGARMMEEEINKQGKRFGRLLTFKNRLYIGPLNSEISPFDSKWNYSQKRQKRLESMFTESYSVNRKLRDRLHS